jgi:Colicin/Pyocin-S2, DNase domain
MNVNGADAVGVPHNRGAQGGNFDKAVTGNAKAKGDAQNAQNGQAKADQPQGGQRAPGDQKGQGDQKTQGHQQGQGDQRADGQGKGKTSGNTGNTDRPGAGDRPQGADQTQGQGRDDTGANHGTGNGNGHIFGNGTNNRLHFGGNTQGGDGARDAGGLHWGDAGKYVGFNALNGLRLATGVPRGGDGHGAGDGAAATGHGFGFGSHGGYGRIAGTGPGSRFDFGQGFNPFHAGNGDASKGQFPFAHTAAAFTAGPHFADAIRGGQANAYPITGLANAVFRDAAAVAQLVVHSTGVQMRDSWWRSAANNYGYGGRHDFSDFKAMFEDHALLRDLRERAAGAAEIINALFDRRDQRQMSALMQAGIVSAEDAPPDVAGAWLKDASYGVALVPGQLAAKLAGQQFANFAEFGRAFWQAVANTPELAALFSDANLARMRQGLAPLAPEADTTPDQRAYLLQQKVGAAQGGEVYDLNNLVIVTPVVSQLVADLRYNYALMNIMYNQFLRDPSDQKRRRRQQRRHQSDKEEFVFSRWVRKKWQHFRRRRRWRLVQLPRQDRLAGLTKRLIGTEAS